MSLDLDGLRAAVAAHGQVVRILVADIRGSTPREAGASMLVWHSGQNGSIGGGALEWQATVQARDCKAPQILRLPLGPTLGQCCGGSVTLVLEPFDAARLEALRLQDGAAVRPIGQSPRAPAPHLDAAAVRSPRIIDGWLIEPLSRPERRVWIWGAGHVGRAIIDVMSPLPQLALTWIDFSQDRFPPALPPNVLPVANQAPAALVLQAPADAEHLVVTHSHALDLALCDAILRHGFASLGLIGSATKRARFLGRLTALGHDAATLGRIRCPIGMPELGKHPQVIALGVAVALLANRPTEAPSPPRSETN
ncbi:MAG: xanthine dehydrogenase accessory protein XdhC [Alkalilacustris sp.]